ncbi:hypothetical protein GYA93_19555 [Gordonia desulfuricans]|uniref:Uncharacterized protein n=1 Tax=Gordonia desulfuricans TaxID=89051 RepID=A0A7K3LU32_9ACTN|nr:hypothetical protein [Gordonia desulfuricans]NDK91752.1 hypothetical protein [Gordonia desulfuricans]
MADWELFALGRSDFGISGAKKRHRQAMQADTILAAATILHYCCDMWAQAAHGGTYTAMARRHCGPGAVRHIVHLANQQALINAWEQAHSEATLFGGGA